MPNEPPAEVKAVVDTMLSGFNSKNAAQYNSAFGRDVVVIDGMAPYRWTGANAQVRWFDDAEKWAHELGVTDETIAYDHIVHAELAGVRAYIVLSATLSFKLKGQPGTRRGILTLTLASQGGEWKIDSQAWGRLT